MSAQKKINDKKAHEKYGMRRFVGAGDDDNFEEEEKRDSKKQEAEEDDVVVQTFEMEE